MSEPLLVLLAHGTADPDGQAALERIRAEVAAQISVEARLSDAAQISVEAQISDAQVVLAFADVIEPTPQQVLAGTTGAVVIPLFVTSGYHVQVDAPAAAASAEAVTLVQALGPDPAVVAALAARVQELPGPPPQRVILAGAGSSRPEARAEVEVAATRLAKALGIPVEAGFLSGPGPAAADLVEAAISAAHESVATQSAPTEQSGNSADAGDAVAVATYLLAPGYFARVAARLAEAHGLRCTGPIGAHPALLELIVARFRESQHP